MRDMEEELLLMKSNGLLSCEERQEEMKQMEVYRSHTKFMKNKVRDNRRGSILSGLITVPVCTSCTYTIIS